MQWCSASVCTQTPDYYIHTGMKLGWVFNLDLVNQSEDRLIGVSPIGQLLFCLIYFLIINTTQLLSLITSIQ